MAALPVISAVLTGVSSVVSGIGMIAQGNAARADAEFQAKQMEARGKEELAASQRDAEAARQEGDLVASRQQALAAASGAGAGMDAPTIVKLMTDTAGQSELSAQAALYGGRSRQQGLREAAAARRRSGRASYMGSVLGGFGQMAGGLAGGLTQYQKYRGTYG